MRHIFKTLIVYTFIIGFISYLTSCKKEQDPLALNTVSVTEIKYSTAISGGNISSDGGASITTRGVCWSTSHEPTVSDSKTEDGSGSGTFASTLTGLSPVTPYYVRAYAINSVGTAYGDEVSFIAGHLTDVDGNTYNTVTIGTQMWMQENLRVKTLNDGIAIANMTDDEIWHTTQEAGYRWYNDDQATYFADYGGMYNGYAVNTGKLCPDGWHVSSDEEWITLTDFLGGADVAGGKLKEEGYEHWQNPNTGATNESGFTALPGGYYDDWGYCYMLHNKGVYSTSSNIGDNYAYQNDIRAATIKVTRNSFNKNFGFSVRCVKD